MGAGGTGGDPARGRPGGGGIAVSPSVSSRSGSNKSGGVPAAVGLGGAGSGECKSSHRVSGSQGLSRS